MRASIATCVVLALLTLTSGFPLLRCPFLTTAHQAQSCCPRANPQPRKECPLSKTLETCPYYVTDAKLGEIAAKALTPPRDRFESAVILPAVRWPRAPVLWMAASTDLYLRFRVLLI